jgi:phosphoglycerate dehydrogenase-like enzyme
MGVAAWRKTLGIVGLGNIGRAVARRAAGFEMRVVATEPQPDLAFVAQHGIELVPLDRLLRESDFVSLHVRLDASTAGMIGRHELALMKPSTILINAARQQLVNEDALADAILNGRLAGAGLDDPPLSPTTPLRGHPGVVFAPHHGNRAIEGVHAVFRAAIDNAVAVLSGRRPESVVNPDVYSKPFRAEAEHWNLRQ